MPLCCIGDTVDDRRHSRRRQSTDDQIVKTENQPLRHNPEFNGPLKNRSCTDVLCLALFFVALAAWAIVGLTAYKKADLDSLLTPTDSNGNKCGIDNSTKTKSLLFYFDFDKCFSFSSQCKQVCVDACPSKPWEYNKNECEVGFKSTVEKLICDATVNKTEIENCGHVDNLIATTKCSKGYKASKEFASYCFEFLEPIDELLGINVTALSSNKTDLNQRNYIDSLKGYALKFVEDIKNSKLEIGVVLVLTMFVCLFVIYIMRWLAGPIVWTSMIGLVISLGVGCFFSYDRFSKLKDVKSPPGDSRFLAHLKNFNADKVLQQKETWLVLMILSAILFIIVFLVILFLRKRIVVAIALIKEGSKAVGAARTTIIFPIFPWAAQVITIACGILVAVHLASIGEAVYRVSGLEESQTCKCTNSYKDGDYCEELSFNKFCSLITSNSTQCIDSGCTYDGIENPRYVTYLQIANLFCFLWLCFFIKGLGEMILAATFATWYWTFKKTKVPFFTLAAGISRTMRFHLGTVAFGALILTICRMIRLMLEVADRYLKKYDNAFTRAIMCVLKCFFWCLEKFLKFVNRNAFIMCAIHGKNFCASAKDAFNLLLRNCLRVLAVDKVTDWLFFISKVFIALLMSYGTYMFMQSEVFETELNYKFGPPIIIFFGAYFIASTFFGVYSMAVDTLFLCFLEDGEQNDGSPEKPYYMSKQLMNILGKKNKLQ